MRGALLADRLDPRPRGIIPADAGSTGNWAHGKRNIRDHPRGCGEHIAALPNAGTVPGSSPRMRGAPIQNLSDSVDSRIIPADAGSTR